MQNYKWQMSPQQKQIWLHEQMAKDIPLYNLPICLKITGDVNVGVLKKCFLAIMQRHETLRTTFEYDGNTYWQIVHPFLPIDFVLKDLTKLEEHEVERKITMFAHDAKHQIFDLGTGPLCKVILYSLPNMRWFLVINVHHIISDGISVGIMIKELLYLYRCFLHDKPVFLEELPIQYLDYTKQYYNYLSSKAYEQGLVFWKKELDGVSALEFPTDRPRLPRSNFKGSKQKLHLGDLLESVEAFCNQHQISLFVFLVTVFKILLHKYSGQNDFGFGVVVANRNNEIADIIGNFINTIVLRSLIKEDDSFANLSAKIGKKFLEFHEHQMIPIDDLIQKNIVPKLHALFVMRNFVERVDDYAGLKFKVEYEDITNDTALTDLIMSVENLSSGWQISLIYDIELFAPLTIKKILDDYVKIINAVCCDYNTSLIEIEVKPQAVNNFVQVAASNAYIAPQNDIEKTLVNIWQEVLQVERIGINDNFLRLGGHSLKATKIASRIMDSFDIDISLRLLFEIQTIAKLAEYISGEINSQLKLRVSITATQASQIPLSFSQQRLWFLDLLEPNNTIYNIAVGFHMYGVLNFDALEKSLNTIVKRHEALRTTFAMKDEMPIQVINDFSWMALNKIAVGVNTPGEVEQMIQTEVEKPFMLAGGEPLFRVALFVIDKDQNFLLLVVHHIIFDGASYEIFLEELAENYRLFCNNLVPSLSELPIQYKDFAYWQRNSINNVLQEQLSYWQKQLSGFDYKEFPLDNQRKPRQTYLGDIETLEIGCIDKLRRLGEQENTTLPNVFLACLFKLLHRYTREKDMTVGVSVANRHHREIENIIGYFVNVLPIRILLDDHDSFSTLLNQVKDVTLIAYQNQDLPFEKILEKLEIERNISRTPIFQIMFNYVNLAKKNFTFPGLNVETVNIRRNIAKFDLEFSIFEENGSVTCSIEYNTDLFRRESIQQLLVCYQQILEEVSEKIWYTIAEFFYHQVNTNPLSIAIKSYTEELSYEKLNQLSDMVGRELSLKVDGQTKRVALLLGFGYKMVVGIFSVLKTGRAYIPLDTTYPEERLSYMLQDSGAQIVLTDNDNVDFAHRLGIKQIINLDDLLLNATKDNLPNIHPTVNPNDLAYILYTSGSSGKPKGVMQNNYNVLRHIENYQKKFGVNNKDRILQLASFNFDAAVMDVFGALLSGATLCLFNLKQANLVDCHTFIDEQKITIYHSTPSVFRYLFGNLEDKRCFSSIRMVVMGGEEVFSQDIALYYQHFSDQCKFVNGFGPTECTMAMQYFIDKTSTIAGNKIPIGKPVDGVKVLLLDELGNKTDFMGEIALVAEHLALGYCNLEKQTNEVFLHYPCDAKQRVYRTSDMARILPDGNYLYLGRRDFQAKIRGYRIEVSDVDENLRQHPSVKESCVIVLSKDNGENYLVACIVAENCDEKILRNFLVDKIPGYMIPAYFVFFEKLPLNPNGKINKAEIIHILDKSWHQDNDEPEIDFSDFEQKIANIWQEVLKIKKVSLHRNFFEVGGHSLSLLLVQTKINQQFGKNVSVVDLFAHPTIKELANFLEGVGGFNVIANAQSRAKQRLAYFNRRIT